MFNGIERRYKLKADLGVDTKNAKKNKSLELI